MENKGFKNCPSVAAFAVGMELWQGAGEYRRGHRVLHVHAKGVAMTTRVDVDELVSWSLYDLPHMELDLSVPWVGRRYMGDPYVGGNEVIVQCMSDGFIGFTERNLPLCTTREKFLDHFHPLPLDPPDEEKEPAATKPLPDLCHPCVPARTCDPECPERVLQEAKPWQRLRPLPPEPPVQKGDVVCVACDGDEWFGRVAETDPPLRRFRLADRTAWICWDGRAKITKLIPEQPTR